MWLLNFLPNWIFYALVFLGIIGLFVSQFIPVLYRLPAQVALAAFVVFGVYMSGAISNEQKWKERVAEVEQKVAEAEAKSAVETIKIVDRVVFKKQIIRQQGEEIVKYIDREVVKYDVKFAPGGQCEIPKEFVDAINKAAQ